MWYNFVSAAFTISSDGTTHKHINYESKHITLRGSTTGHNKDNIVKTLCAGINTAPSHTSAEKFLGWMNLLDELSGLYKDSELGGVE